MNVEYSDGGKEACGFHEEINDCSVRSIANISGLEYSTIHEICRQFGRENCQPFENFNDVLPSLLGFIGLSCQLVKNKGTVNKFLQEFSQGYFLVVIRGHCFAVIDGVIKDIYEQSGNQRIKAAWWIYLKE